MLLGGIKMDYLQIANSPTLWIACAIPVLLIAFQAVIFVCKSLNAANALGITKHQINSAVRSSAIASFGPSVVVAIGALGLVLAMGGPISWLRLSFIGAVQYELTAATFGAQAANATFETMTPLAFANAVWTMTICSVGWLLMTVLCAKKFDKMTHMIAGNNQKVLGMVSVGAMLGCFGNLCAGRLVNLDAGTVAVIVGFVVMCAMVTLAKKTGKQWVSDWSLTIAMVSGMVVTIPITLLS